MGSLLGLPLLYLLGGRSLARRHRESEDRARRDPLTGLGNHRAFVEQLAALHAAADDWGMEVGWERADAAGYEAKRRGRNRAVAFGELGGADYVATPEKVRSLRQVLAEGRVHPVYQAIWNVERNNLLGYEALSRFDTDLPLDPQEAFEVAERIGHVSDLDALCRHAALHGAGTLPPGALLFVNLAPPPWAIPAWTTTPSSRRWGP